VGDGASIEIALNLPYRKINGTIKIPAFAGMTFLEAALCIKNWRDGIGVY